MTFSWWFSFSDVHYCWDYRKFYDTLAVEFLTFSRNLRLYVIKKFIASRYNYYIRMYLYTYIDRYYHLNLWPAKYALYSRSIRTIALPIDIRYHRTDQTIWTMCLSRQNGTSLTVKFKNIDATVRKDWPSAGSLSTTGGKYRKILSECGRFSVWGHSMRRM